MAPLRHARVVHCTIMHLPASVTRSGTDVTILEKKTVRSILT